VKLFAGGSMLSLLAHELRLFWRSFDKPGKRNRARIVGLVVVLGVLGFGLGWPFAMALNHAPIEYGPVIGAAIDAGLVLLLTLMMSTTVSSASLTFYERGDLDLLLSSPVPAHRVLAMRCARMAVTACAFFMLLITPVVAPAVAMGHPKWLSIYPVLAALALFATAIGLLIATSLFRLIGPRRTKTLSQVMAALIGGALFLTSQMRYLLPPDQRTVLFNRALSYARSGPFGADQPLSWPARAVMGEWEPAVAMLAVGLIIFLLVTRWLGNRFAQDAAAAAGVGAGGRRVAKGGVRGFEGGPFGAMVRKETRLLFRDPALLSQVLLRVVYLVPIAFVILRGAGPNSSSWFWGGNSAQLFGPDTWIARSAALLVFLTTQLAGTLAWITVSAEDAPELLASAPAKESVLRRAKLTAAMTPVMLILGGPLIALTWLRPWAGAVTTVGCVVAALSACLIALWYEKPAKRSDLRRRRSGSLLGALAETFISFCWAAATWFTVLKLIWAFIPAVIALGVLLAIRRPARSFAETLQLAS
jgi:ABC-2 type transport system permease protein